MIHNNLKTSYFCKKDCSKTSNNYNNNIAAGVKCIHYVSLFTNNVWQIRYNNRQRHMIRLYGTQVEKKQMYVDTKCLYISKVIYVLSVCRRVGCKKRTSRINCKNNNVIIIIIRISDVVKRRINIQGKLVACRFILFIYLLLLQLLLFSICFNVPHTNPFSFYICIKSIVIGCHQSWFMNLSIIQCKLSRCS